MDSEDAPKAPSEDAPRAPSEDAPKAPSEGAPEAPKPPPKGRKILQIGWHHLKVRKSLHEAPTTGVVQAELLLAPTQPNPATTDQPPDRTNPAKPAPPPQTWMGQSLTTVLNRKEPEKELPPPNLVVVKYLKGAGVSPTAITDAGITHKVLPSAPHPMAVADFDKEIHALLSIPPCPNLVPLLAIGPQPPNRFIVLGGLEIDLGAFLRKNHWRIPLAFNDALAMMIDLGRGVRHMHAYGWIHRDLKPDNLGLTHRGVLKIMDLNIARPMPDIGVPKEKRQDKYQMTGETGSMRYMAPEVLLHQPYNLKVDVYSMGIIFRELLAPHDERPFLGMTVDNIKQRVGVEGQRPDMEGIPHNVQAIMREAWHQDSDKRPTAAGLVEKICQIVIHLQDTKWKIHPMDLFVKTELSFEYDTYMKTLQDWEKLCARLPERTICAVACHRFLAAARKLKDMNDERYKNVLARGQAFGKHFGFKVELEQSEDTPEGKESIPDAPPALIPQQAPMSWPQPYNNGEWNSDSNCVIL